MRITVSRTHNCKRTKSVCVWGGGLSAHILAQVTAFCGQKWRWRQERTSLREQSEIPLCQERGGWQPPLRITVALPVEPPDRRTQVWGWVQAHH